MNDPTTRHRAGLAHELTSTRLALRHAMQATADRPALRPLLTETALDAGSAIRALQHALTQLPMHEVPYV